MKNPKGNKPAPKTFSKAVEEKTTEIDKNLDDCDVLIKEIQKETQKMKDRLKQLKNQ